MSESDNVKEMDDVSFLSQQLMNAGAEQMSQVERKKREDCILQITEQYREFEKCKATFQGLADGNSNSVNDDGVVDDDVNEEDFGKDLRATEKDKQNKPLMVQLLENPEQVEENILKESRRLKEETRKGKVDRIREVEKKYKMFEQLNGMFHFQREGSSSDEEDCNDDDCDIEENDTKSESDDEFTDVFNLANIIDMFDVVDFTTADRPWMEYYLTEPAPSEKRKETLAALYEEDPLRYAFVLDYHTAILRPFQSFLVKLLAKRKVWSVVEARLILFNVAKAENLFVFTVPGVSDILELSVSIFKGLVEKVPNLHEYVRSWVESTVVGEPRSSAEENVKEIVRELHKRDAKLYGFIVSDYMLRDLSLLQNIFYSLVKMPVWPFHVAEIVSTVSGLGVKQLVYEVPEITEIYHLGDSICKGGKEGSKKKIVCLREKVKTWVLNTDSLKKGLLSWAEDAEMVKRTMYAYLSNAC